MQIPICLLRGITSYTGGLEFMIFGALALQVGTATLSDPCAAFTIARDLEKYALETDVDLNDLVGTLRLN